MFFENLLPYITSGYCIIWREFPLPLTSSYVRHVVVVLRLMRASPRETTSKTAVSRCYPVSPGKSWVNIFQ
jgi:hypothetical protein